MFLIVVVVISCIVFVISGKNKKNDIDSTNYTKEEPIALDEKKSIVSSEQDILNDLQLLFSDWNWYESIEWEFWFNNDAM